MSCSITHSMRTGQMWSISRVHMCACAACVAGLLFAYGVTNAGKTFTIMGNEENPGILPRALGEIFSRLKRDEKTTLLAGRWAASTCPCCESLISTSIHIINRSLFQAWHAAGRGWPD